MLNANGNADVRTQRALEAASGAVDNRKAGQTIWHVAAAQDFMPPDATGHERAIAAATVLGFLSKE